ncbi:hypothetical protein ABC733_17225 [Mangrovibacter sp. SLW1]
MKSFYQTLNKGLVWLPELGMGRFPVPKKRPYDAEYFSRYKAMADTPMGKDLTSARISLVSRHYSGVLVDVGIGAGQFVEARPNTKGFDVNPAGIDWLKTRGAWADIYTERYPALSFWDSLEHIDRPDVAVARAEEWVFVSVPIFEEAEHVIRSRHYRKDEHIWYWTEWGLIHWFFQQGFELAEKTLPNP